MSPRSACGHARDLLPDVGSGAAQMMSRAATPLQVAIRNPARIAASDRDAGLTDRRAASGAGFAKAAGARTMGSVPA